MTKPMAKTKSNATRNELIIGQRKITKLIKSANTRPREIFMIVINLGGVHTKIHDMKWDDSKECYVDTSGDFEFVASLSDRFMLEQLVFLDKKDAQMCLDAIVIYRDFLVRNFMS
jgi:hypothetical protein